MNNTLSDKIESIVRDNWGAKDPDLKVKGDVRPDGKTDMTIISTVFDGKDAIEREEFLWPLLTSIPRSEMIHMTYCLLLTPDEAIKQF